MFRRCAMLWEANGPQPRRKSGWICSSRSRCRAVGSQPNGRGSPWLYRCFVLCSFCISVSFTLHRRFIRGLRQEYDYFWNSETFGAFTTGVVTHHCWEENGCRCKCFEDSVQGMSRTLIQTMLLRRPKKPEIKEWTAVGSAAMLRCMTVFAVSVVSRCI